MSRLSTGVPLCSVRTQHLSRRVGEDAVMCVPRPATSATGLLPALCFTHTYAMGKPAHVVGRCPVRPRLWGHCQFERVMDYSLTSGSQLKVVNLQNAFSAGPVHSLRVNFSMMRA